MSSLRTTFLTASFRPRRTCMKLDPSTFLRSVAGKAVLATGVVLLAFGGAAAAGFTDVPTLLPSGDEPTLEDTSADDSSSEATDESADDESEVDEDESESEDESSADESSDGSASDEPNHGQIVSEFAHTTELEGCEKGQAISDLASSNATDHRQNPEKEHDPCNHGDESGDDSAEAPEVEAPEASGDDESGEGDDADESHGKSGESHGKSGESHGKSGEHGGGHGDD